MILELLRNKHYSLLLLGAILFLILFSIKDMNENLMINIHDTYYVISNQHGFILVCLIFLIPGLFYFVFDFFKIQVVSILSLIHVYGSLIFIGLFFLFLEKINSSSIFDSVDYNLRTIICLTIFIFLQLIFVINLITSIIKKLGNSITQ